MGRVFVCTDPEFADGTMCGSDDPEGCDCPWNNGYRRSPLGHHVNCPALVAAHFVGDGCENRLPYGMGHVDPSADPLAKEE